MSRFKFVQKWIDSSPLRKRWWDHDCPECGNPELTFSLVGTGPNVKRVHCHVCRWGVGEEVAA